jgi:hypothetical protein
MMPVNELKITAMKQWLIIAGLFILFAACSSTKKVQSNMRAIDVFKEVITGDFDNARQVADEIAAGKQVHPSASHINRIADSKIEGLPTEGANDNFWIIEESYYQYPGKPLEAKPYLFNFSQGEDNTVLLKVYQFPAEIVKDDIKNNNVNLKLKFSELKLSPSFKDATYTYNPEQHTFTTNAPNELGNGMRFTLIETLSKDKLIVMELLEKDGKRLTPYDTPIIYYRK